jgi:hypothetical protein
MSVLFCETTSTGTWAKEADTTSLLFCLFVADIIVYFIFKNKLSQGFQLCSGFIPVLKTIVSTVFLVQ